MSVAWLLITTAFIEAVTGISLITVPNLVAELLFGEVLTGAGLALARVAGVALFALGVAAWSGRHDLSRSAALAAMITYNIPVAIYLTYLGISGHLLGVLLWPAAATHAALGLFLTRAWFLQQSVRQRIEQHESR